MPKQFCLTHILQQALSGKILVVNSVYQTLQHMKAHQFMQTTQPSRKETGTSALLVLLISSMPHVHAAAQELLYL